MAIDTPTSPAASPASHPPAPPLRRAEPPGWRRALDRVGAERAALAVLLLGTAVLYLWGLGDSGWANSFYAAAAQAGSESWTAFFFGSSDAANAITVDKTPLSLWPMALSIKLFGLSSWSLLVPQALEGVAAVAVLHAAVRRATGSAWAGILAGTVLAVTPVAVLMFRFDNPDALLVLLLTAAAYGVQRALESPRPVRWLALAGALVGLAFLTKMLQAFLVLPAFALAYGLFATAPLWRRLGRLLVALAATVLAGGWWVAVVELVPASARPWVGGSQGDSVLELTLGYNGLGRLNGEETGSVGGGNGWGQTGLLRLFDAENGGQAAWLLPAALVLGAAALWFARRSPSGEPEPRRRALQGALTMWLGWLVVTALTFSLMAGIYHAYYTVALAPAVGALVGTGAWVLWRHRASLLVAGVLGGVTACTAVLAFALLGRAGDWFPWLRWTVLVVGLAAALLVVGVRYLPRRLAAGAAGLALVASLAGPAAYSLSTAATPHEGSIPSAGPATSGDAGPGGRPGGFRGTPGGPAGGPPGGGAGGGAGGLLQGSEPSAALTDLLLTDAEAFTWVAATVGSNAASGYQLATEEPVMSIGGFNGSDPSPTLAEFQQQVADGEVHYFIASGRGGFGSQDGGSDAAAEITAWVTGTFEAQTVDGVTLYDLSTGVE